MKHLTPRSKDQKTATYIIACGLALLIFIPALEGYNIHPMIKVMAISIIATACMAIAHVAIVPRLKTFDAPPPPTREPKVGARQFGDEVILSSFAEKRIRQQLLGYKDYVATFEQRKSLLELFAQMEARHRTDIDVKRRGVLRREKGRLSQSSTLYAQAFAILVSLILFGGSLWIGLTQYESSNGFSLLLIIASAVAVIWNGLRSYVKWSRVYHYRLVALKKVVDGKIVAAALVLIDKPPFLKGGEVFPLDFSRIQVVKAATFEEEDNPGSWRSNIAGQLNYEGVVVDTYSGKDKAFNWLGPFHNAPVLVAEIDHLRAQLRQKDM